MSTGSNFQCLSGRSSRLSSRSRCSSGEMCRKHLSTGVPAGQQLGLELVDGVVAPLDLVGVDELAHLGDQHVLVVGAVEDADPARGRQRPAHPPQEVVGQLLLGGTPERGDLDALRVDERATVWRTTPPLPEVSMPCSTSSTLRLPPLRPSAKSRSCRSLSSSPSSLERLLAVGLVAVEAGGGVGRQGGQVDGARGQAQVLGDHPGILPPPDQQRRYTSGVVAPSAAASSSRTTEKAREEP